MLAFQSSPLASVPFGLYAAIGANLIRPRCKNPTAFSAQAAGMGEGLNLSPQTADAWAKPTGIRYWAGQGSATRTTHWASLSSGPRWGPGHKPSSGPRQGPRG